MKYIELLYAIINTSKSTLDTSYYIQFHILNDNVKNNDNLRIVAKR